MFFCTWREVNDAIRYYRITLIWFFPLMILINIPSHVTAFTVLQSDPKHTYNWHCWCSVGMCFRATRGPAVLTLGLHTEDDFKHWASQVQQDQWLTGSVWWSDWMYWLEVCNLPLQPSVYSDLPWTSVTDEHHTGNLTFVGPNDDDINSQWKMAVRNFWAAYIATNFPLSIKPHLLFPSARSSGVYCMTMWNILKPCCQIEC